MNRYLILGFAVFVYFILHTASWAAPSTQGGYVGVGITIEQINGKIVITEVRQDGPAEKAGILRNDEIILIDSQMIAGLNIDQVGSRIRGPEGTEVAFGLARAGHDDLLELKVVRAWIEIQCFIEGWVDLQAYGTNPYYRLDGWLGRDRVYLDLYGNRVSGWYKGERLDLNIYGDRYTQEISGWIHNQYVRWRGQNGWFHTYQNCIE